MENFIFLKNSVITPALHIQKNPVESKMVKKKKNKTKIGGMEQHVRSVHIDISFFILQIRMSGDVKIRYFR